MKQTRSTDLPLLPTSAVGSHAPTGWLLTAIDAIGRGEMGQDDIDELMRDATDIAVLDMERAGLDVLVDGEMRRNDFNLGFYVRLHGIEPMPPARRLGPEGHDQRGKWRVFEDISAPNGLGCVEDFAYVQSISDRPVKACVPGPFTLSGRIQTGGLYKDRIDAAWALVPIVNAECRALQEAGARFIQVDEPSAAVYPDRIAEYVQLFNAAVAGIDARIGSHICFGNFRGRPGSAALLSADIPGALRHAVRSVPARIRQSGDGRDRAVEGVPATTASSDAALIDVKNYWCETPEVVAERIRAALKYVAPDKLWIVPDCGFSQTARWATKRKLAAMVQGAQIVRRELAG